MFRAVIGTLYCAKGNFEFGISRIIKVTSNVAHLFLMGSSHWIHMIRNCIWTRGIMQNDAFLRWLRI